MSDGGAACVLLRPGLPPAPPIRQADHPPDHAPPPATEAPHRPQGEAGGGCQGPGQPDLLVDGAAARRDRPHGGFVHTRSYRKSDDIKFLKTHYLCFRPVHAEPQFPAHRQPGDAAAVLQRSDREQQRPQPRLQPHQRGLEPGHHLGGRGAAAAPAPQFPPLILQTPGWLQLTVLFIIIIKTN